MDSVKKVTAVIEASKTGFGIFVEDDSPPLTNYGDTIDAAKKDLHGVLRDMIKAYPKGKLPDLDSNQDNQIQRLMYYHYTIGQ